jgi:hypothetical protein
MNAWRPFLSSLHRAFVVCAVAFSGSHAVAQGALIPPPGAPVPSMRTLEQIEPRIPIDSVPIAITQAGSYYLTRNLEHSVSGQPAISITASNVTLDFMGHTLSSVPELEDTDAVSIAHEVANVVVRNGVIAGQTVVSVSISGSGINNTWTVAQGGFRFGIVAPNTAKSVQVNSMRVSGVRSSGFTIWARNNSVVDCAAVSNGLRGFDIGNGSRVSNSVAVENYGDGFFGTHVTFDNVTAERNRWSGFFATSSSAQNCQSIQNGSFGFFLQMGVALNCVSRLNFGAGFNLESGTGTNCVASQNGGIGFEGSYGSLNHCVARQNSHGFLVSLGQVSHSVAIANTGSGFMGSGSVVAFCRASSNGTNSTITGVLTGNLF